MEVRSQTPRARPLNPSTNTPRKARHERKPLAHPLEIGRRRRQRLAGHPERLLGRDHGAPGLGHADHRPAARRGRLPGHGPDAAGDLHHQHGAGGARALARPERAHEDAGCRRLRGDLPDDQHARRGAEAGGLYPLRAARHAQLRADPRAALQRRRLRHPCQRHHRHLRDDRDGAGARQPGRHPVRGRARRDLHRAVGPVAGARLPAGVR